LLLLYHISLESHGDFVSMNALLTAANDPFAGVVLDF
jgi:hypothetical protein